MHNLISSKEAARLLRITKQAVLDRAARENWAFEKRPGKGGGKLWLTSSMPKGTRAQIASALTAERATELTSKQISDPVNTKTQKDQCHSLHGIPEHGRTKSEAKAWCVNYVTGKHKDTGEPISNIMFDLARMFKARSPLIPAWVLATLRTLSRGGLDSWKKRMDKEGVRGLAKLYDKRDPQNIIDNTPELRELALSMLWEFPHTSAVAIERAFIARFGPNGSTPDPSIKLPSLRRIQAWRKRWVENNAQLFLSHTNPDAARSKYKMSLGDASAHITYPNQEWQSDSTRCDLMLNDGRYDLVLTIDVFTRRLSFHVSRTSSSAAVSGCMRKGILKFGLPTTWKTDNGKEYTSAHMQRVCATLGIYHELCPPYSPEKKPFVERAFKTFLHSHVELLPGYIGHNVAERKAIESRKRFAKRMYDKLMKPGEEVRLNLSSEELQKICDDWAEYVYGNDPHSSLGGMTPNEKAAASAESVRYIPDERALDVLLLPVPGKNGLRTVGKKGLRIATDIWGPKFTDNYISTDISALLGREVLVRFDVTPGRVLMFAPETSEYLGKAESPRLFGYSREDVRNAAIAAERKRKADLAAEKKEWRKTAKRVDVRDIGNEIIEAAKRKAAKAAPAPLQEAVPYTNPALVQAARARTGDFGAAAPEQHAVYEEGLKLLAPLQPTGFVPSDNPSQQLTDWRSLYDRKAAGERLDADEQRWFVSFYRSYNGQAYCEIHGLAVPEEWLHAA